MKKPIRGMLPSAWLFFVFLVLGCARGDEPATIALMDKLSPHVNYTMSKREDRREHVVTLGIKIESVSNEKKQEILKLLPHITKLKHLISLGIGGSELRDDDLKTLPPLPNLRGFNSFKSPITDNALPCLSRMNGLERLSLIGTRIRGSGLSYLKDFSKLEKLELGMTPINDEAFLHIAANFPRLKRLSLGNENANITPDGLMKLVDLHWLNYIHVPANIVGPDPSKAATKEERRKLKKERSAAYIEVLRKFAAAHIASKQKARAAGEDVPEDKFSPFSRLVRERGDSNEGRKGRRKRDAPAP